MRIVAWNCNMALHRKAEALLALRPDIAIISECASPEVLAARGVDWIEGEPVWAGDNPNKGLGVFAFNGFETSPHEPRQSTLRYILPVHISGPARFNLLAAWAQNASGGVLRKHQLGPLRRSLTRYRDFLSEAPFLLAGDLNSNAIWDKPGWRINHMNLVAKLSALGLTSAYHSLRGETHGAEIEPTLYWRDRTKDGPTYHLDYIFTPPDWLDGATLQVGSFEDWIATKLSDHVPLILDVPAI